MFEAIETMDFFFKCAPFRLKIEEDLNIDDYKRKKIEIGKFHF
jgi:hypothetical protein